MSLLLGAPREFHWSSCYGVLCRLYHDGEVWIATGSGEFLRFGREAGDIFDAMIVRQVLREVEHD